MAQGIISQGELKKTRTMSDGYLVRFLWRFLRPYRFQVLGVLGLLFVISALNLVLPYLIQVAVDDYIVVGDLDGVWRIGLLYVGIIFLIFVVRYAQMYWLHSIGQNTLVRLRQHLYEHILK